MPELPEVEVLVRHLRPILKDKTITAVAVRRKRVLRPTSPRIFAQRLRGATFEDVSRRGKYLLFEMQDEKGKPFTVLGHLGMTGRMFLALERALVPKHTAVILGLGREKFIFEDTRYFGRLTLDTSAVERLGPEPLSAEFTEAAFANAVRRSSQSIKVKLLDQTVVAGVGNIYASEALFRAGISPRLAACRLKPEQIRRLRQTIREVLKDAIRFGSTVPLSYVGENGDGLFYFGSDSDALDCYSERLRVYDRAGEACLRCKTKIKRIVQAARSTFFCPRCQGAAMRLR
jgi:formamidopyrimidine-DNA glycosylase